MTTTIDGCQLEFDDTRGVIYVHGPDGVTRLRVCRVQPEQLKARTLGQLVDVVAAEGFFKLARRTLRFHEQMVQEHGTLSASIQANTMRDFVRQSGIGE